MLDRCRAPTTCVSSLLDTACAHVSPRCVAWCRCFRVVILKQGLCSDHVCSVPSCTLPKVNFWPRDRGDWRL